MRETRGRLPAYIVVFLLFIAEATILNKLKICGVRPDLLLVTTVFFGFHFGVTRGAEIGFIAGLLKDTLTVGAFGINTFSFLAIGILAGCLKNKLFKENLLSQFFFSFLAVYLLACVHFLSLGEMARSGAAGQFWSAVFRKGLYTAFLAGPLFLLLAKIFGPREA